LLILLVEHGYNQDENGGNAGFTHSFGKIISAVEHSQRFHFLPNKNRRAKNPPNEPATEWSIKRIPQMIMFTPRYLAARVFWAMYVVGNSKVR
jgi:hypothetical protein